MAKATSPSFPHKSGGNPSRHVDIAGVGTKLHVPVKNNLGGTAIGGAQRSGERATKGR